MRHYYISKRQLEAHGEPLGDMSYEDVCGRRICHGGGKGDSPPPPDYTPVANASKEAAEISAQLGREQLAENRRQFEAAGAVAAPIVAKQGAIMDQTLQQGKDYYDYMVSQQRPVEQVLNAEAMKAGSDQQQQEAADKAVADVRQGSTAAQNQLVRQGLRYGWSPAKIAAAGIGGATQQGLAVASAANTAREKEKSMGFAKKMDVAGLYRGLPGASQGAYGVAINAGNSANQNNMAPGQALMQGINQGNNTIMGGRQIAMQGLTGVLNAQTSAFNSGQNQDSGLGGMGSLLGGAASMYTAFGSDRRIKENIKQVGKDERTGLNLYEFTYIGDDKGKRYVGVMADEVEPMMPDAVVYDDLGFASVNYDMLGIEFKEVA